MSRRTRMKGMRVIHVGRRVARLMLTIVRWWAGVTYLLAGVGGMIAAPFVIAGGDAGGWFLLVGGPELALLGWLIHPWGFQRWHRGRYFRRTQFCV